MLIVQLSRQGLVFIIEILRFLLTCFIHVIARACCHMSIQHFVQLMCGPFTKKKTIQKKVFFSSQHEYVRFSLRLHYRSGCNYRLFVLWSGIFESRKMIGNWLLRGHWVWCRNPRSETMRIQSKKRCRHLSFPVFSSKHGRRSGKVRRRPRQWHAQGKFSMTRVWL